MKKEKKLTKKEMTLINGGDSLENNLIYNQNSIMSTELELNYSSRIVLRGLKSLSDNGTP